MNLKKYYSAAFLIHPEYSYYRYSDRKRILPFSSDVSPSFSRQNGKETSCCPYERIHFTLKGREEYGAFLPFRGGLPYKKINRSRKTGVVCPSPARIWRSANAICFLTVSGEMFRCSAIC